MADQNYLYTIGGYVTLIGVGYIIYQASTRPKRGASFVNRPKSTAPEPQREDKKSKKKQRLESFVSDSKDNKPNKSFAEVAASSARPAALETTDDEFDNREFAKQFSKAQQGKKFDNKSDKPKQREKSVKQSRANKINGASTQDKPSAPSSNGADADDDQSPIASPEAVPADSTGVADMLEPAPAGPSVLRLTDTAPKDQKVRTAKVADPVETKKQRQNRKKAEAAKAAREEAEKERRVLEEKQRRTARIAEGRAAKDGSQFMAANGKNSWKNGAPNGQNGTAPATLRAPLDTFEKPATAAPEPKKPVAEAKKLAPPKNEETWMSSLPSEEEQMEMLKSEADEWNTVKTKSSKKNKKASSVESGEENVRPTATPTQPAAPVKSNPKPKPAPTQSFGSYSALSSKNEPAEEEGEEEWDV